MASKPSSSYLKRIFNHFNRIYWANSLPANTIVRWVKPGEGRAIFGTKKTPWGAFFYDENKIPTILIDEQIRRKHWRGLRDGTLLHEMVHLTLKGRDSHGKVFQREMKRLANLGAFRGIW